MSRVLVAVALSALALGGCSLKHLTVNMTAEILKDAGRAFDRETDVELAASAIPGSLKTIEGFLEAHPEQPLLLQILAESYMNYAFGFLEDEAERLQEDDPLGAEILRQRALVLHLRARGFGLRLLALELPELAATLSQGQTPTQEQLAEVGEDELPALFWTANPWAAAINVGKSDPGLLAQLSLVKLLIERCVEIDETYFWAGPQLVLGAMEAGLPTALGGQPERAKRHFDRAVELTEGKHLMTRVLYARTVGVQTGDRELFTKILEDVVATDPNIEPTLGLANRLAQRRAKRYLAQVDDLFL